MLKLELAVFMANTVCTLRCRKCITLTPYQRNPVNYSAKALLDDVKAFFTIYDWADHIDFEGGETLLNPQFAKVIKGVFDLSEHFDRVHVLTNGTVALSDEMAAACKGRKVFFIIDDYGPQLSTQKEQLVAALEQHDIPYRVDAYHGPKQYYGGWLDLGDMNHEGYTEEQRLKVFQSCREVTARIPCIKEGKVYICPRQASGAKHVPPVKGEYLDLYDTELSLEQKKEVATHLFDKPIAACHFCKGFVIDNPRIDAAEQLPAPLAVEQRYCL